MKQIKNPKPLKMVEVFYTLHGERVVTAYKRTEALEKIIELSSEGATITKLVEFTV